MSVVVERHGRVALIEMQSPPHNYLTPALVNGVASALEEAAGDVSISVAVVAAQGRSFCAGANFGGSGDGDGEENILQGQGGRSLTDQLYEGAARLCSVDLPWIAAVQGPAIGGGLGLAMTANIRVTCPEARFSANFAKLGIHQGFGLSVTLPEQLGPSKAAMVLFTGRRFRGEEALDMGIADLCVPADDLRETAMALGAEIAEGAPLALRAMNRTLRAGLADRLRQATRIEAAEQMRLGATKDAGEGIMSVLERRLGQFQGC